MLFQPLICPSVRWKPLLFLPLDLYISESQHGCCWCLTHWAWLCHFLPLVSSALANTKDSPVLLDFIEDTEPFRKPADKALDVYKKEHDDFASFRVDRIERAIRVVSLHYASAGVAGLGPSWATSPKISGSGLGEDRRHLTQRRKNPKRKKGKMILTS